MNAAPQPTPRFSRNDRIYLVGLLLLFVACARVWSWGMACLVLGTVLTVVSVATSFFYHLAGSHGTAGA